MNLTLLHKIKNQALAGEPATIDECLLLADSVTGAATANEAEENLNLICDAADEVRTRHNGNTIDTCSIINGKSGKCPENCKWCSQSRHWHTGCDTYDFVPEQDFFDMLGRNDRRGVQRFSIVCSGRKVSKTDIIRYADLFRRAGEKSAISLCASMGLLGREELQTLYDAGVRRYHCNLETAASFFPSLCTTHTRQDKLDTIRAAREVGMEVCSGGIIGMGEDLRQRLEFIEECRDTGAISIPVNLLNPIPGTPLQDTPLLSEQEIILSVALMRFIAPTVAFRFAGGRARLSKEATRRILRGGMNGCMVGDMLTTHGNDQDEDFQLFRSLGYTTGSN